MHRLNFDCVRIPVLVRFVLPVSPEFNPRVLDTCAVFMRIQIVVIGLAVIAVQGVIMVLPVSSERVVAGAINLLIGRSRTVNVEFVCVVNAKHLTIVFVIQLHVG